MSAARPDSWMPLYWGDYARDTAHLGAAMHGAYLMLIKHYWCSGGPLPDDDAVLWRVATCDSPAQWKKMRPTIAAFFHIEGGEWRHKRIEDELRKAADFSRRQAEKGKKGGRPRKPEESPEKAGGLPEAKPGETKPQPQPPSYSEDLPDSETCQQDSGSLPRAENQDGGAVLTRPPSDNRSGGVRTPGDVLARFMRQQGPPEKRLKRQDRADADMVRWLTTHGGFDVASAWALLMAARDDDDPGHTEAARELEGISAKNRLGWFAEESAA
jgi:uncharacterized protein YdaU (DUF1376 family)